MLIYKYKQRGNNMSKQLNELKTISDMLEAGKTVNIKNVEDLINQLSTDDLLELLNHALSKTH